MTFSSDRSSKPSVICSRGLISGDKLALMSRPSTSSFLRPASSNARWIASAAKSVALRPYTLPMAVTPRPTIAHFPLILILRSPSSLLAAFPLGLALLSERLWALNKVLRDKQVLQARSIGPHRLFDRHI